METSQLQASICEAHLFLLTIVKVNHGLEFRNKAKLSLLIAVLEKECMYLRRILLMLNENL